MMGSAAMALLWAKDVVLAPLAALHSTATVVMAALYTLSIEPIRQGWFAG